MRGLSRRKLLGTSACAVTLLPDAFISTSALADDERLAIKGYDPVAYFKLGSPALGRPLIEYKWDELIYRFVSAEHREVFKSNPIAFMPQFGNFCTGALSRGEVVEADPKNWIVAEGMLYLFSKPAGPVLFRKATEEIVIKANTNRSLIEKRQ